MSDNDMVESLPEGGVNPRATAQNIAKNIVDRQSATPEPAASPVADVDRDEYRSDSQEESEDLTEQRDEQGERLDVNEAGERQTPESQRQRDSVDEEITDEIYQELQSYGIDLGVPPSRVAPELKDSYNRMAQTVIKIAAENRAEAMEAQQRQMQVQDFMQRLEQDPTDIMMLVALNKPEKFQEAMETYERIQGDPREREILERELRLRAQEQAQTRREQLQQRAERQAKANRVKSQLKGACQKYGVNPQIAERLVAAEIRNKGDISALEINQIVSQLKPSQTLSPERQRKAQETPNRSTGGTAPSGESQQDRDTSPGLKKAAVTHLRGTIKDAVRRHSNF